jgi:hypothetical protein
MKKSILSVLTIFSIAIVTFINIQSNDLSGKEDRILLADLIKISHATAECGDSGATVDCQDVENYGSGSFRHRICVDENNNCYCEWNDHEIMGTLGTCTP